VLEAENELLKLRQRVLEALVQGRWAAAAGQRLGAVRLTPSAQPQPLWVEQGAAAAQRLLTGTAPAPSRQPAHTHRPLPPRCTCTCTCRNEQLQVLQEHGPPAYSAAPAAAAAEEDAGAAAACAGATCSSSVIAAQADAGELQLRAPRAACWAAC
jgi:hypothetical protein